MLQIQYDGTKITIGEEPGYKCGEMYDFFNAEEYQLANIEEILIYQNIKCSRLHKVAVNSEVFPCVQ